MSNVTGRDKMAKGCRYAGVEYYVRPEDSADDCVPQKDPEVTLFSQAIINIFVRKLPVPEFQWWPPQPARADGRRSI